MSDPTSKHKPYTTGAEPSTTAAKANIHMSNSGWVRTITATDHAWAGNDDANSDPEILVAFRGAHALQGFFTYMFWHTKTPSQGTPVLIDIHVHFSENVTVTGSPTFTIGNTQGGTGGGGTAATLTATYNSGSGGHYLVFRTPVPSANQLKAGDILFAPVNALALSGGTIKDGATSTNTIITNAAVDSGYNGSANRGGNYTTGGVAIADGPRLIVEA